MSVAKDPVWEFIQIDDESVCYLEHGVPHNRIHWHVHEQYELHFIVKTHGKVMIGNHLGPFSPGHLSLVGPWLPHNWESHLAVGETHQLRDMVIQFKPELFNIASRAFPELSQFASLLEQAKMGIEFLDVPFEAAETAFQKVRDSKGVTRLVHFLSFIDYLSKQNTRILSNLPPSEAKDAGTVQSRISEVVDYVMHNYQTPIRLKTVADMLGMTESYFSRFFHQSSGHRFTDFVNRVRIQRACVLLSDTEDTIADISKDVGFHNLANFSRQFRRIKGVSPLVYRKNTRHWQTNIKIFLSTKSVELDLLSPLETYDALCDLNILSALKSHHNSFVLQNKLHVLHQCFLLQIVVLQQNEYCC
ncbi:AraC family transcriptional regulator [Enterovibrio nigricans]|uniref:AraC-type DNA-binding protein n=1 Tax=Enterovibrio nigricans DSM 22720 TaxID=1121868 RepID=A0A1T4VEB1_9GAMM|nr:AraC family transcriptional regulator [Enterovibrio nigricans]SKA63236.1 AraC-type DNA-binding protein [Enterovibrio nigricans DSM 22720]